MGIYESGKVFLEGGEGEGHSSSDTGSIGSFSPNSNSFTTSEGNSAFGFSVDLSQADSDAFEHSHSGTQGGLHPDSISKPRYPAGQKKH